MIVEDSLRISVAHDCFFELCHDAVTTSIVCPLQCWMPSHIQNTSSENRSAHAENVDVRCSQSFEVDLLGGHGILSTACGYLPVCRVLLERVRVVTRVRWSLFPLLWSHGIAARKNAWHPRGLEMTHVFPRFIAAKNALPNRHRTLSYCWHRLRRSTGTSPQFRISSSCGRPWGCPWRHALCQGGRSTCPNLVLKLSWCDVLLHFTAEGPQTWDVEADVAYVKPSVYTFCTSPSCHTLVVSSRVFCTFELNVSVPRRGPRVRDCAVHTTCVVWRNTVTWSNFRCRYQHECSDVPVSMGLQFCQSRCW